jgi:sugar phosphate isomerase/epimerase
MISVRNANFTRRSFLPLAAGTTTALLFSRSAWAKSADIPTGIQLYTVKDYFEKDPAGTLHKLAEIGYTEVEISTGKVTAAQFTGLLRDAGLRAPSVHLMFGMADTGKLLDDAKTLGVQYVVSSILPPRPLDPSKGGLQGILQVLNSMTADDFKQTAANANEIAAKAKAAGLQYAYHNHNFEFRDIGGGQTGYDILLRETDPSIVKFEADCGWMRVGGVDPVHYLTQHSNRYVMLHIKDFQNITKPVTTLMAPDAPAPTELGRGDVNLKAIVETGRKIGIKHMFVEQEPPYKEMTAMEAAAVDYSTLHSLLASA